MSCSLFIILGYHCLVMLASIIWNHLDYTVLFVLGSPVGIRVLHQRGCSPVVSRAVDMDESVACWFTAALDTGWAVSK